MVLKILFIITYWVCFVFLRQFLIRYDIVPNNKIYNIVGVLMFVCLLLGQIVLQSFFRAYLGAGKPKNPVERIKLTPQKDAPGVKKDISAELEADVKKDAPEKPEKKSRIRVLGPDLSKYHKLRKSKKKKLP